MTIEVPTPSADLISQIETAKIEAEQNESTAVAAIRERFAPYAKHNGFITTSYELTCFASSNGEGSETWEYLRESGRKTHGLLCFDSFSTDRPHNQNSGTYTGKRLWLTDAGWVCVTRSGDWSQWQGSSRSWEGRVDTLTDAMVSDTFKLADILEQLGTSMSEMCKKLPERYNRLKARAEMAQRVLTATASPLAQAAECLQIAKEEQR